MQRGAWVGVVVVVLLGAAQLASGGAAPQRITITMREFSYTPARIVVPAGAPVAITLINKGKLPHEFMIYDRPKSMDMMLEMGHEWVERTNYFRGVRAAVTGGKVRRHMGDFLELKVAAGASATITFTPVKKGTFEYGCMIEDHYEGGQKGVLVVR